MIGHTLPKANEVIARARKATSYGGECDASLRQGLERTLAGFAMAPLTAESREIAIETVEADLAMRFRIERYLQDHPEIEQQKIEGPLLVTGLPRSGTTATLAMLALDPRFRFTRDWELKSPLPPPILGKEATDPRVVAAHKEAALLDQSIHLSDPDGPEEDLFAIAGYDMRQLQARYAMPQEYLDWYIADDFRSYYRMQERLLKLLQWHRPPNFWLLKAPPHILRFEAFVERYPGSSIVMTHRDPARTIASVASIYHMLYEMTCPPDTIDKAWTGRRCLDFWSRAMKIAMRTREEIGEDRFIDVYNHDLVADPVGTLERLYGRLGFEFDENLRAAITDYHRRNAKGAHGVHSYTLEEFGLTEADIDAKFREYREKFKL